jgi:hypothetical protein
MGKRSYKGRKNKDTDSAIKTDTRAKNADW